MSLKDLLLLNDNTFGVNDTNITIVFDLTKCVKSLIMSSNEDYHLRTPSEPQGYENKILSYCIIY